MIQALADHRQPLVALADFNAQRALPNTRQHLIDTECRRQQPIRHCVALQPSLRRNPKMQAFQARRRHDQRVQLGLVGKLLQSRHDVAPNLHHV